MSEYFDIVDKNGNLTGKKKLRSLVHRGGDLHKAVHVWILNSENELLIQKRSESKDTYPGHWTFSVGGHVSSGKTSKETVVRETKEELGVEISSDDIDHIFSLTNEYNDPFTGAHD